MTKSHLTVILAARHNQLTSVDTALSMRVLLNAMAQTLASGNRIEIRGFGCFSLHFRSPRLGRNPMTGVTVPIPGRLVPYFRPGKALRERVNRAVN